MTNPIFMIPFMHSVRRDAGHHLKSALKYTLTQDSRNDMLLPTSGHFLKMHSEVAGLGGDAKHIKYDFDLQKIFGLGSFDSGCTLGVSVRQGAVVAMQGKRTILPDRFFLGGPLSVRGFQFQGLSPGHQRE